jgi:hypothetical protein
VTDTMHHYTQRDRDTQAKRTRQLAAVDRNLRNLDAKRNHRAFAPAPGMSVDEVLKIVDPGLLRQERAFKAANDELAELLDSKPADPELVRIMGLEDDDDNA